MYRNFLEIEEDLTARAVVKRVALANAHDDSALAALVAAKRKGLVAGALIGHVGKIKELLREMGEAEGDYALMDSADEGEAAKTAAAMVNEGNSDIIMKGLLQTSVFMKAILDKAKGFVPPGGWLCHATVLEDLNRGRMMIISDCAVCIAPDLEAKAKIIRNAVALARKMGIERPKVAVISAVEAPKSSIPSTMDAKALSEMPWEDCIVGGPFALDNAVSLEAARRKGIDRPAMGEADVLIMPDLCAGNIFTKSLTYFARLDSAGVLCGAAVPVAMSSRADTARNKYCALLAALLQSLPDRHS